ncbi:MAG TPA: hypothetical protein VFH29_03355 [Anaerolineales bacterium]|nr:hypothetical protein [Anaerolineales bacterium]
MVRALNVACLLLVFGMGACVPAPTTQPVLPTFVQAAVTESAAVPAPNEAYPTAQASESSASQSVSGFSLSLRRAWREGKQVNAEVCFSLPDSSDWTIWAAHYEYGGNVVSEFSSALLSKTDAQGGQPAERCDQISFYVPPDADLSASTLTVESVGAYPDADEYCSLYMPKIQQTLTERGIGITLDCPVVDGVANLRIATKPAEMSQEEAEQLVFSDEFYTVRGPWSFPVTFSQ